MHPRRLTTNSFALAYVAPAVPAIAELLRQPQFAEIFATLDTRRAVRVLVMAGTQFGKNLIGQLFVLRLMLVEAAPTLWYGPTEEQLRAFVNSKFHPLFEKTKILHSLLYRRPNGSPDPSKRTTFAYRFADFHVQFLSFGAEINRQSHSAQNIIVDESAHAEDAALEEISRRHDSKIYNDVFRELHLSTGARAIAAGKENPYVALWKKSDQRRWHFRCANPACDRLIEPRLAHTDEKTGVIIGGLIYETHFVADDVPDEARIKATVRHRCPHCGHELPDTEASRLALSGTAEAPRGAYVATNAHPSIAPVTIGFAIHGMVYKPWSDLAVKMVHASLAMKRGDLAPLEELICEHCGDIFDPEIHRRDRKESNEGDYYLFTPPSAADQTHALNWQPWPRELILANGAPARFAAVDVQQDHFVLVIRSWAADYQSRLFYCEKILAAETLAQRIRECGVRPSAVFLDTRYNATNVRRLCAAHGWRPIFGDKEKDYDHGELGRRPYSLPKWQDPWIGTVAEGKIQVCEFNYSKVTALESLELLRTFPRNDGELHWSYAKNSPDWYRKEVDAFWRVPKKTADGTPYHEFTAGNRPDHAADAECIALIQARMADLAPADSATKPNHPEQAEGASKGQPVST